MIEYASPATRARERRERTKRAWARVGALALLALLLCFVSTLLPVSHGRWYVGHRPQWMVAIDSAGLTLGPTDRARVVLGPGPLVGVELLLVCLPVELAWRLIARRRTRRRGYRPDRSRLGRSHLDT